MAILLQRAFPGKCFASSLILKKILQPEVAHFTRSSLVDFSHFLFEMSLKISFTILSQKKMH